MSLILEALRKLEREKQAPERGFLVMAHTPWGSDRRLSLLGLGGLLLAVAAIASLATVLLLRRSPLPAAPAPAPSTQPAGVSAAAGDGGAERPLAGALPAKPAAVTGSSEATREPGAAPPLPAAAAAASPPALPVVSAPAPSPHATASPSPPPPELRLMAISQQDGRPVAIVNDRLVREGDSFEGVRIIRIGDAEVEVEVNGQKRVLTFQ